jgi:hypothetical protein
MIQTMKMRDGEFFQVHDLRLLVVLIIQGQMN